MRIAIGLPAGWLLAALVVLGMDGRLPVFLAWVVPGSLLVRQQLAPSRYNRTIVPARYQVADDLRESIAVVVAVAEQDATIGRLDVPDSDHQRWRSP